MTSFFNKKCIKYKPYAIINEVENLSKLNFGETTSITINSNNYINKMYLVINIPTIQISNFLQKEPDKKKRTR
jgi:hypothetical protein